MCSFFGFNRPIAQRRPARDARGMCGDGGRGKDTISIMNTIRKSPARVVATSFIMLLATAGATARAADWPAWRGPAHNGMAYEKAAVRSWTLDGANTLWKSPIGGRTTPIIIDGRLFFIAPAGEGETLGEQVVCLDAATGEPIWQHRFNVFLTDTVEQRVGWTAVVADPETKYIYAHGTGGQFFCFDFDGNIIWEKSLTELYNRVTGYGGRVHTPIVDEDKVIISFVSTNWGNHAPPSHRYLAMDKRTGEVVWWARPGGPPADTTYAVPVVTVVNGVRLLVAAAADGWVYGMKVRTGETVWSFKLSKRGINASVVADGNRVYVTHSEENYTTLEMGSVICIDAGRTGDITESGTLWRVDGVTAGYASPALAGDRLYIVDNAATLHCFDAHTGAKHWSHECGRIGRGSPTVTADGVIYVPETNGRFTILKDEGDAARELSVVEFPPVGKFVDEIFGSPIVLDGRLYLQTRYGTYCIGAKSPDVQRVPVPALAEEAAPLPDRPATLLVVPGEITVEPGEEVRFTTRLFDQNGQPLTMQQAAEALKRFTVKPGEKGPPIDEDESADVKRTTDDAGNQTWTAPVRVRYAALSVPGEFNGDTLTVDENATFTGGMIRAHLGGLTADARVRICPPPPVEVTFDDMKGLKNPSGWVGAGAKTQLTDLDGNIVFEKLAPRTHPSAPFMRMEVYTHPPLSTGYTVQCDLMGRPRAKGRKVRPDMGLINARYVMRMMGQENLLRLETWSPIPRLRVDVPWEWKTDVWYTAKMTVELVGDRARVRAKVWPRDEEEPSEWRIEMFDPTPHFEGSPGLYAYSNGTKTSKDGPPIYFDNYRVFFNQKSVDGE